jgi:hypothetical protein
MAMTSESPTRFVFVLGTGRCGSSLVHEILAQHESVGFLSNIEDRVRIPPILGRWNGPLYRRLPPTFTEKGRIRFAPSEGYHALSREVSPMIATPVRDLVASDAAPWLKDRFHRFFQRRAEAQTREVFLHKFTGWPRAGFIDAIVPEASFIHVIRDGRAVANSLLQMAWWKGYGGPDRWGWGALPYRDQQAWEAAGRSFSVLAALEWKVLMGAFAEAKAAIDPGRWIDLRYEDLLRDPTSTIKGLMEFMGADWTTAFDERFRRYRFEASRAEAFRRDLARSDVASMENVIGVELRTWGYTLSGEASS